MKILVLNHDYRICPRVNNEITTLSTKHEVTVLSWNWTGTKKPATTSQAKQEFINLKAPRGKSKSLLFLPLLYRKILKKTKNKSIDIIHCTHLCLLPLAVWLAKTKKAKLVYDAYERYALDVAHHLPQFPNLVKKIVEFSENRLVARSHGVLTIDAPNDLLKRRYQKYNPNTKVLYNVPNLDLGPDEQLLNKLKQEYRNQKIIIYIGGFSKIRGILKSIELAKMMQESLPRTKLILMGTFYNSQAQVLELIDKFKLKDQLTIIDWLPYRKMMAYLQIAQVGLAIHQPSNSLRYVAKGTGRKFFTYMQAGLPIVGPKFAQIGQVVREAKCGLLVDTTDTKQIIKAITYLLQNPNEAKKLGQRGRKAVLGKYNWQKEQTKLLKVYQNL